LICPLDWGLGHAVRDIPLIRLLIQNHYQVIIAADGLPAELLKKEFPDVLFVKYSSKRLNYSKIVPFEIKMAMQIPKILYGIYQEHQIIKKIAKKYQPDLIISDNRYGAYIQGIPSVFITHQLYPKLPKYLSILQNFVASILHHFIKTFDLCMIPDVESTPNLSGTLSHGHTEQLNIRYIGPISRFENHNKQINEQYEIAAILSGPEPQRSILEQILLKQLNETNFRTIVVGGKHGDSRIKKIGKIDYVEQLCALKLEQLILKTPIIITRSGYTSVMDLIKIKKSAILIPTPRQTEQEYLAEYLSEVGYFVSYRQKSINISSAVENFLNFNPKFANFTFRQEIFLYEIERLLAINN